jgi:hypothetical protein
MGRTLVIEVERFVAARTDIEAAEAIGRRVEAAVRSWGTLPRRSRWRSTAHVLPGMAEEAGAAMSARLLS